MLNSLFVVGCIMAMLGTLATLLWSPAPCGRWCHAKGLLRWGVFAGAAFAVAEETRAWALMMLVWSVAGLYLLQARSEAERQRREREERARVARLGKI